MPLPSLPQRKCRRHLHPAIILCRDRANPATQVASNPRSERGYGERLSKRRQTGSGRRQGEGDRPKVLPARRSMKPAGLDSSNVILRDASPARCSGDEIRGECRYDTKTLTRLGNDVHALFSKGRTS
jgi:hypothetical protein